MKINIQNVSLTYPNGKQAFTNLSLDLQSPGLIGLLGPNGAGKSTLMKLLVAALMPDAGSVRVDGRPLTDAAGEKMLKSGWVICLRISDCSMNSPWRSFSTTWRL